MAIVGRPASYAKSVVCKDMIRKSDCPDCPDCPGSTGLVPCEAGGPAPPGGGEAPDQGGLRTLPESFGRGLCGGTGQVGQLTIRVFGRHRILKTPVRSPRVNSLRKDMQERCDASAPTTCLSTANDTSAGRRPAVDVIAGHSLDDRRHGGGQHTQQREMTTNGPP
jgi:hypothetical protein